METFRMFLDLLIVITIAGVSLYLKSYLTKKGENLATKEDFDELQRQLKESTTATEQIKQTINRKESAKSKGINLIRAKIAQIEARLLSWSILVHFRDDELKAGESIEILGIKDLKLTANYIVDVNTLVSEYSIYFEKDTKSVITKWLAEVYKLLFDFYAVYESSIITNKDKDISQVKRFENINTIMDEKVNTKLHLTLMKKIEIDKKFKVELDIKL